MRSLEEQATTLDRRRRKENRRRKFQWLQEVTRRRLVRRMNLQKKRIAVGQHWRRL